MSCISKLILFLIFENSVDHDPNSLVALRFHCVGQSVLHLRRLCELSSVQVVQQIFIRILVQREKHLVPSLLDLCHVATVQLDVEQFGHTRCSPLGLLKSKNDKIWYIICLSVRLVRFLLCTLFVWTIDLSRDVWRNDLRDPYTIFQTSLSISIVLVPRANPAWSAPSMPAA